MVQDRPARKFFGSYFDGHGRQQKRSEEHTSELQSQSNLVCRLLLEKKKKDTVQETACKTMPDLLQRIVEKLDQEIMDTAMPILLQPIYGLLDTDLIEPSVGDVAGAN